MSTKKFAKKKLLSLLLSFALVLSLFPAALAADAGNEAAGATFENLSDDGADVVSLTVGRSFKAMIPVNDSVDPETVTWTMEKDPNKSYVDPELFPNQTEGGAMSSWQTQGREPMFGDVTTSFVEGEPSYLVAEFTTKPYFSGTAPSAPHANGGSYLDLCGFFNLTAADASGKEIGSVPVKIVPYDSFHTMDEIYEQLDEMVDFAEENTDIFVKKYSMGLSTGDIYDALDMPYMIFADSEESVTDWLAFTEEVETNPSQVLADIEEGVYDDIKVPVLFSNIHANEVAAADGIMDFAWMLLEAAASDGQLSYNKLTGFTEAGQLQFEAEKENDSLAIPDLVKDTATYLGYLKAGNRASGVVDLDEYYEQETVNVDLDELLDDIFFILVPEENVEGRTYITRTASNGYDLNRDNSFQSTSETQNMQKLIGTFNPVSFTEFHGMVPAFQCEPCDPPHEPNFEYDLLAEHLIPGGEALGIAAVANNSTYNSYVTPQRDYLTDMGDGVTYWSDPWDDMSTSYTPQFAMLHGTVSYTVELPGYNDAGADLVQYGCLGQSVYVAGEKLDYLTAQAKIYERGVSNFNSDAYELVGQWFCDQYDVEGAESELFRPEFDGAEENENFYPECYIIPLDPVNQSNLQAAHDMMEWLSRNDVKILLTEDSFTYDGVTYPEGTMIISMYQAKRSVANGALYDGTLIENWTVLYSEGITSFAQTRGFDMVTVAKPAAYTEIAAVCGDFMDYQDCLDYLDTCHSAFSGDTQGYVIISNASEDSAAAVNALLKEGKSVGMVTDEDSEYYGDFVCTYTQWLHVANKYMLTGTGIPAAELPEAMAINQVPVVFVTGTPSKNSSGFVWSSKVGNANWNYDRIALELMGFETTENPEEASAIIGASALSGTAKNMVLAGTPYIAYGSSATNRNTIFESNVTRSGASGMDCLGFVTYPNTNLVNASYVMDEDDVLYGYGVGYFSAIPEGAEILVQMDSSKEPTEGFIKAITEAQQLSSAAYLNDSVQAFSFQGKLSETDENDVNVVFFANSLTHKVHQRDEYGFISNFIFSSLLDGEYLGGQQFDGGNGGGKDSGGKTPSEPATEPGEEPAEGGSEASFVDVPEDSYYEDAVAWAVKTGVTNGTSETTFAPLLDCSRAQVVTFLWRAAGSPEAKTECAFVDVPEDAYYADAVAWAAENGITKGASETTFDPDTCVTRAQFVTFLWRAAGCPSVSGECPFVDVNDTATYFYNAVLWAAENGITKGTSETTFSPDAFCARAQVVTFLYRYFSK